MSSSHETFRTNKTWTFYSETMFDYTFVGSFNLMWFERVDGTETGYTRRTTTNGNPGSGTQW